MCRNIRPLYNFEPPATQEEIRAAAIQYVRKISGFSKPSQANAEAFERAVDAVAECSARLIDDLVTAASGDAGAAAYACFASKNCSSSVEPFSAAVDDSASMVVVTASK